jgi:NAD(P)-dependent dehydrogenase (short-subunit alcohol dehydrogenase family)
MDNQAAFITGGTGWLGRAVTGRFLRGGYRVAVSYRSQAEWQDLSRLYPDAVAIGSLLAFDADVTQEGSIGAAIDQAADRFGGLNALIHLAGGYKGGETLESVDPTTVRGMIELNLLSAFWAAKQAIPHLKRSGRGRLLFVSSRGAVLVQPGAAAYAAAKLGIHALVETLAKELRETGVTANAVLPSVMDTPPNRASMPDADSTKWVLPDAVAELLAFLASSEAGSTSGALIPIYGRA